jgi:hypothetical protein
MTTQAIDLQTVQRAFDDLKIIKGQTISFATCDAEGNPNVAPIGSMRIVDHKTVHVLQGFLAQSMANLKANPRAAFSVCLRPRLLDIFKSNGKGKEVLGYRVYCNFTGSDDSPEAIRQEYQLIARRVPFFLRRPFLKFCNKNLKRLLKFEITDIREVS